jgi:hypothetical protein
VNEDALRRVDASLPSGALDALAGLPGSDLTTAMIELSRRRANALSPADVLTRYRTDRFTRPGALPPGRIREIEAELFELLPEGFEEVALSPVTPLAMHGLGGVAQSRVLTTDRGSEVAADPTNGLALEAATRRQDLLHRSPRSTEVVRLAGSQRVTRAQRFKEARAFSHFQLLGLVSAGRDTGNLGFERQALAEHLRYVTDAIERISGRRSVAVLTDLADGRSQPIVDAVVTELGSDRVELDPDRQAGRGYYRDLCWKVHAVDGERFEVADGGFVDWTQRLLSNAKERLLISGLGIERLAMAASG